MPSDARRHGPGRRHLGLALLIRLADCAQTQTISRARLISEGRETGLEGLVWEPPQSRASRANSLCQLEPGPCPVRTVLCFGEGSPFGQSLHPLGLESWRPASGKADAGRRSLQGIPRPARVPPWVVIQMDGRSRSFSTVSCTYLRRGERPTTEVQAWSPFAVISSSQQPHRVAAVHSVIWKEQPEV